MIVSGLVESLRRTRDNLPYFQSPALTGMCVCVLECVCVHAYVCVLGVLGQTEVDDTDRTEVCLLDLPIDEQEVHMEHDVM